MSMSGQRRLELERQRREELRLEQVRRECQALAAACEAAVHGVEDLAVQQIAGRELGALAARLRQVGAGIQAQPDASIASLAGVQAEIQGCIARAEAGARAWSDAQVAAVAQAREAEQRAKAVAEAEGSVAAEHSQRAVALAREARRAAEAGSGDAAARLERACAQTARARDEAHDERVRREVARALVRTLRAQGFQLVGPRQKDGLVVLEGRQASGRKARFSIAVDGRMAFDLDGYEGRACAEDMEKVEATLRDRFGVALGPPQVTWKNPDRISRGAKDLPGGAPRRKGV
jgi:hypothetical protein